MSASDDPLSVSTSSAEESRITRLFARARGAKSLTAIAVTSIGVIVFGFTRGLVRLFGAAVNLVVVPLAGAAIGLQNFLVGLFNSLIRPVFAGALGTSSAIGPGSQLALVGLPLGVGMVLIAAWMLAAFRDEDETTDSVLIGTSIDLPIIGTEEEPDAED
jgi:hypothetical protein